MSGQTSTAELLIRLAFSLSVVLILVWVLAKVMRKTKVGGGSGMGRRNKRRNKAKEIEVLARQPLSKNASLALVRVAGRDLVVGVTEQSVRVLDAHASVEDDPLEDLLLLDAPVIDVAPQERVATASLTTGTAAADLGSLTTPRTATGRQPRMNLFDALKEATVRRR